jgi:hypothetical protein
MRYEMTYRCGHRTHATITGRNRTARIARAQADHASQPCGICRSLTASTYTDFTGGRHTSSDGIDVLLATHKPNRHVLTTSTYPGGGLWASPAWVVTVRWASDDREMSTTHRLHEHNGHLVPPAAQDVQAAIDDLLARMRATPVDADSAA